ncbi:MAG: sigma-54 interaction domain-containing protein [Clostridia bacterium]
MTEVSAFAIAAMVEASVRDALIAATCDIPGCSILPAGQSDPFDPSGLFDPASLPAGVDLVLLDPDTVPVAAADGISLIKAACQNCDIVLLLDAQDITVDVEMMKIGAYGYMGKHPDAEALRRLVMDLMAKNDVDRENKALAEALDQTRAQTIISHSPEMEKVLSMAARAARSDSTVLIVGESGTGKELIARAIHLSGPRKNKPFIPVNVAALPENLVESELFGHVKGAFTGAMADRAGRFALANGGTLFIDEIGELPAGVQVRLLRVIQFGSYERVGENQPRSVDVRIIAATKRDLEEEVRAGRFRPDLYYRVNVVPLALPALRDHRADLPYLVEFFIRKYANRNHKSVRGITAEAMGRVMRYTFRGNIRELENVIERGVVLCRGEYLTETDIFLPMDRPRDEQPNLPDGSYEEAMSGFEREYLGRVLVKHNGNKSAAARELGINERRLRYRLKVLGMDH